MEIVNIEKDAYEKFAGQFDHFVRYLSDVEVSHRLKISRRTLQEYRDSGIVPYIKLGGKVLYRESDLEKLLEECYHPAYRKD